MDLEISRITDCASWHTVVGMEYSTVFDKCPSPVNWVEPMLVIDYMTILVGATRFELATPTMSR